MSSSRRARRRLEDRMLPIVAAGLIRFPRARDIEHIKLSPRTLILLVVGFIALIMALNLTMPLF